MGYRGKHETQKPRLTWENVIEIIEAVAAILQIIAFLADIIRD